MHWLSKQTARNIKLICKYKNYTSVLYYGQLFGGGRRRDKGKMEERRGKKEKEEAEKG